MGIKQCCMSIDEEQEITTEYRSDSEIYVKKKVVSID
jgi:hypothetical protein